MLNGKRYKQRVKTGGRRLMKAIQYVVQRRFCGYVWDARLAQNYPEANLGDRTRKSSAAQHESGKIFCALYPAQSKVYFRLLKKSKKFDVEWWSPERHGCDPARCSS